MYLAGYILGLGLLHYALVSLAFLLPITINANDDNNITLNNELKDMKTILIILSILNIIGQYEQYNHNYNLNYIINIKYYRSI